MSSNSAQVDPRVRRTRRMLRDALFALLESQSVEAITVQQIAAAAELNRVTFYLHYRDKYDLLTQSLRDILDELAGCAEGELVPPHEVLARWFAHAAENAAIYRALLGREGMAAFAAEVRSHMEALLVAWLTPRQAPVGEQPVPVALQGRFLAAAYLGALGWWLEQRQPYSPQQMATWLWGMSERLEASPGARG